MFANVIDISSILLSFGIFYGHLVYFMVILVYFPRFGLFYLEKSGNPGGVAVVLFPAFVTG
jgi:hypothetical protein